MITFSTIKNEDYMVIVKVGDKSKISAYKFQNGKPVLYFSMNTEYEVTGCVATESGVIITRDNSNTIYDVSRENYVEYDADKKYVLISRLDNRADCSEVGNYFLMKSDDEYVIYDLNTKWESGKIPFSEGLTDIKYSSDEVIMLTNHVSECGDDELIYKIVVLDKNDLSPIKYTGEYVHEEWMDDICVEEIKYNMHYPLFGKYLYRYPANICISAFATCYLQRIEKNIILAGSIIDSNCIFIVEVPDKSRNATFYYNEREKLLYIADDNKLEVYYVNYNNDMYEKLNAMYNSSTNSLQHSFEFERLFYKCLESTKLEKTYEVDIYE